MVKWLVYWEICGDTEIEADSAEEAQSKFERLSVRDLADNGELQAMEPETAESREAQFREFLHSASAAGPESCVGVEGHKRG